MSKIDPNFPHDMYQFIHKPIRDADRKDGRLFVERFLIGPQTIFEDNQKEIAKLPDIIDPAKTRSDLLQYLKSHVGFTRELNNITNDLSENDLRKLISLAVALWKQKGIEPGYINIVRLFTGKSSRVFNWFDFRLIVGEKAFGEEQLGEDAWLIAVPGVEASEDTQNVVVSLLTLENNTEILAKDRSLIRNDGNLHGDVYFYSTPATGFPQGSDYYAAFRGGVITQPNHPSYDLSGDLTIEFFFRTSVTQSGVVLASKMDSGGKGFKITLDSGSGSIQATYSDGVNTQVATVVNGAAMDDDVLRHFAMVVDRNTDQMKLFLDGDKVSSVEDVSTVGDITNTVRTVLAGSEVGVDVFEGDMDNFRMSLSVAYAIASGSITPPLSGFIEFEEEALDEYQTDIRIVDDKTGINKTLILRILNLMRPVSERLNVIFVSFYDDFFDGIGNFDVLAGNAFLNANQQMELQQNTFVTTSVFQDTEFQDMVLQVKANDNVFGGAGGIFSVLFFVQDQNNFYEFRIDTINRRTAVFKTVGGIETQIGSWVDEDIVPQASYIFTVSTFLDQGTNETFIQTYVDSNKTHSLSDDSFVKGKFGMKTAASTVMQIDEIEMIEYPVDVRRINPGFDL